MVLPRSLLLLCVAAALALSDVGTASAEVAGRTHSAHKGLELPHEIKYHAKGTQHEHGAVETATDGGKKHHHHHHHHHRQADVSTEEGHHESSIRVQIKKHAQSMKESEAAVADNSEEHHGKKHHHHARHHAQEEDTKEVEGTSESTKHHGKKHHHHARHHANEVVETTGEDGEVVRTYDYGSVQISGNSATTSTSDETTAESKKHHKHHHHRRHHAKKDAVETAGKDGESVQTYEHGSVRTTDDGATATESKKHHKHHHHGRHHAKKQEEAATDNQDVKSTADEVTELATQLASTSTDESGKSFFTNSFAPVVMICGIIGSLALVIGVVALVTSRPSQEPVDVSSVLDADIDVEANVTAPEAKEDAPAERRESLSDSESDGDDEAEGTFANSATVSV